MIKEKKKVALVIPSLQAGGMERVMSELVNYFSKKENLEVHLVLYGIKRDIFYSISNNIIIHKPEFMFNNRIRTIATFKTLFFLRKKLKEIQPDTILSFGEYWNNFVLLSLLGLRYPIYVSDRSQPNKSLGKFQDKLREWLYPKANGVILQTRKAKEIYSQKYRNLNIEVIGNPIRNIENKNITVRENSILMVGRLIATKHQDRLIKIFSKIENKDWKLIIVGYDHLKQKNSDKLKTLINDLKLNGRVLLEGKQSNVEAYYCKSKIFAFTSSSEGFPNVIGEAMSAGLPVISYNCIAGPSEMISDSHNGYLIPLFDDDLFLKKLELLIHNEELRNKMALQAKQSIREFNLKSVSEKFLSFIFSHDINL